MKTTRLLCLLLLELTLQETGVGLKTGGASIKMGQNRGMQLQIKECNASADGKSHLSVCYMAAVAGRKGG